MREIVLLPYNDEPTLVPPPGVYNKLISQSGDENIKAAQLSIFLALVINSCIRKNMNITHTFPTIQADILMQAEDIVASSSKFGLGDGLL